MIHEHVKLGAGVWVARVREERGPPHPGGFGTVTTIVSSQGWFWTAWVRMTDGTEVAVDFQDLLGCRTEVDHDR